MILKVSSNPNHSLVAQPAPWLFPQGRGSIALCFLYSTSPCTSSVPVSSCSLSTISCTENQGNHNLSTSTEDAKPSPFPTPTCCLTFRNQSSPTVASRPGLPEMRLSCLDLLPQPHRACGLPAVPTAGEKSQTGIAPASSAPQPG